MNEDLDDRRRDADEPSDDAAIQIAKSKTSTVGTFVVLAALFMFLVSISSLVVVFALPKDPNVMMLEWMKGLNPDPQYQAEMQKQIDARVNLDPNVKMMEKVMNAGFNLIGMVGNALVLYAGLSMRSLKSYTMCIVGSVFALILNGCCCVGLPVGIWALVVLLNPDVKNGFSAMSRRNSFAQ